MPASSHQNTHDHHYVPQDGQELEHEIVEHIQLEGQWEKAARLNGHIAALLDHAGKQPLAAQARQHAQFDLHEAEHEGEHAIELLLEQDIEEDLHLNPESLVAKMHSAQPHLDPLITALHESIGQHISPRDPMHHELEHVHSQLQAELRNPIEGHQHAVATLHVLSHYFHLVQRLAETHEQVREVWLIHVETLMTIL